MGIQSRGVQNDRVGSRHERRYRSRRVTSVAFRDLARKGGKANTGVLFFQLLIAPLGALFSRCRQEHFERCTRKDHGAHVAPVRDQAGGSGGRDPQSNPGRFQPSASPVPAFAAEQASPASAFPLRTARGGVDVRI